MIPSVIKNHLERGLTLTQQAPWIDNALQRSQVRREYAELHQALKAIDEFLRDWKPIALK